MSRLTFLLRHGSHENALFLVALAGSFDNGGIACAVEPAARDVLWLAVICVGCVPAAYSISEKRGERGEGKSRRKRKPVEDHRGRVTEGPGTFDDDSYITGGSIV